MNIPESMNRILDKFAEAKTVGEFLNMLIRVRHADKFSLAITKEQLDIKIKQPFNIEWKFLDKGRLFRIDLEKEEPTVLVIIEPNEESPSVTILPKIG